MENVESEKSFSTWFLDAAHLHGWLCRHNRPAMTGRKDRNGKPVWVTAYQGDGVDMDWYCVNVEQMRAMWVELKSTDGNLSGEQADWLETLLEAGQEAGAFWPGDRELLLELLGGSKEADIAGLHGEWPHAEGE